MSSPAPTTKELLNRLASWTPSVRQSAIEQAKQLEPDALLDLMQQGQKRLQRRHQFGLLICGIYIFGCVANAFGHGAFIAWRHIVSLLLFASMVSVWMSQLKLSLIAVLENMRHVAFIPHLVLLLSGDGYAFSPEIQRVQTVLVQIIPHMSQEQAHALTPSERKTLLKPLTQSRSAGKRGKVHVDYVLTMLKAMEQIGDQREVELVEQLASIPIRTDMDRRIQQAAAECLPYLQIRAEEQRLQTTLLRPTATASSSTGDDLLRATVAAASTAPPEQLLRATRQE